MKYLFASLAFYPMWAHALLGDLVDGLGGGSSSAPEIDGPVAVVAVTLIAGIAALVKRSRAKQNADRAE